MAIQKTLSIIKPDATRRNIIGKIIDRFESDGLRVVAMRMEKLTADKAGQFYAVHKERPFYNDLVSSMTTNRVVLMVLEGENAVLKNREIMGATNPAQAAEGTVRKLYAESIEANSVHGSDSEENAKIEIYFFFNSEEICQD
jgi:nucleoside-diphosphate kinase